MAQESDRDKSEKATQSYAALGVGFVCVLIGLPLWWKTTEVYRVQLPYGDISELATAQLSHKVFFTVVIFDETLKDDQLSALGEELKETFQAIENETSTFLKMRYQGNIRKMYPKEKEAFLEAKSIQGLDSLLQEEKVLEEYGRYFIALMPPASTLARTKPVLGPHRTLYIKSKPDVPMLVSEMATCLRSLLVDEAGLRNTIQSAIGTRQMQQDKESMRSVRYQPGYEVTFTLLNPQPDILNVRWDIQQAVNDYLAALTKQFQDFAEINIKSQYLHYTRLSMRPKRDESGNFSVLQQDELPHIINPIEAHLGSHVSNNPHFNFIVYVPSRDQSPLLVLDRQGDPSASNAFLSPRWGGMLVYNTDSPPEGAKLPYKVKVDMKVVMETFLSQLRLLLGVPSREPFDVIVNQPGRKGVAKWELDSWLRARTMENAALSAATLHSLVELLEKVGNIVINDNIGNEVSRSVKSTQQCLQLLAQGKLKDAFLASRQAIISSEKAFFDPSLLELLYFPEDQKFAIYIPLFLPISIPVFLSLVQAIKWLKATKLTKQTKQKTS